MVVVSNGCSGEQRWPAQRNPEASLSDVVDALAPPTTRNFNRGELAALIVETRSVPGAPRKCVT